MTKATITQKIQNTLAVVSGSACAIVMASEISNPEYWWVQAIAGATLFVIIKLTIKEKI